MNLNTKTAIIRSLAIAALALATGANAITITPLTLTQWSGTDPHNPDAAGVASKVGYAGTLQLLYKMNVDGVAPLEEGSYKDSYSTTFANSPSDPEDATITHALGFPSISGNPLYLLVKGGAAHNPIWYIFDLLNLDLDGNGSYEYGWNGTDTIELDGFWPAQGAISHVSIFGPANGVPDGGITAVLLGLAMLGMANFRRFIS
jgi:hypothetical protein